MRRKKLLEITLCAVLTIGALLCCMQDASARETLLISGNADLYPIESYDRGRECYVGLLPELYERLSEQTGYDLVYLPYSKNTTQAQQAENRQADIISAYPSGTVDSGAMRRQVLLCTIEHDGAERAIYVGFTNALTPELAGALAQALEDLSGAESIGVLADYMNSSGAEAYRTRWLITLAALIAAMLAAAVALIVFARKKRAEQKTNALIDPRYGIGNDGYYLNCMETLIPAPLRSIVYVFCIGGDMCTVSRSTGLTVYLHYEPVGINNWSVVLGVSEAEALAGTRGVVQTLSMMAIIVTALLLSYLGFMVWYLASARRGVYRMSITDQGTGLMNRVAYEKCLRKSDQRVIAPAACIYIDANGLHEINNERGHEAGDQLLHAVAERLREQFPRDDLYRVGGDEFVVFPAPAAEAEYEARMRAVSESLAAQGYSISYGIAVCEAANGLRELVREADEKMLGSKRAYYAEHDRRRPR